MKRLLISTVLVLISFSNYAKKIECLAHPDYPNNRGFSAEIELIKNNDKLNVKIGKLNLSDTWPLERSCSSPLSFSNATYVGSKTKDGFKFGLDNGKECGFVFHISINKKTPTLLMPHHNYKVFGEKPFLARCKTL
jgi:hypothetical protein